MPDIATNRQARHKYHLLEKWEAGLVLTGTEVKSLREGKAQIKDGYASLRDGEVWLHNVHIPPYAPASRENHEPERSRKLLMHKREIERLIGKTREKGLTLVPTRLYFKGGRAKVESNDRNIIIRRLHKLLQEHRNGSNDFVCAGVPTSARGPAKDLRPLAVLNHHGDRDRRFRS